MSISPKSSYPRRALAIFQAAILACMLFIPDLCLSAVPGAPDPGLSEFSARLKRTIQERDANTKRLGRQKELRQLQQMHDMVGTLPVVGFWLIGLTVHLTDRAFAMLYKTLPDVSSIVHDFYKAIINPGKNIHFYVKIAPEEEGTAACITTSSNITVQVDKKQADEIEHLHSLLTCSHRDNLASRCSCPESTEIQKKLDVHRFIAQHEAVHIREKHIRLKYLAAICTPLLTYLLGKISGLRRASIPNTIAKLALDYWLSAIIFGRYLEKRADNGVLDDKTILHGGITFMKKHHQEAVTKNEDVWTAGDPNMSKRMIKRLARYCMWIESAFQDHPTPLSRAAVFRKRIRALK